MTKLRKLLAEKKYLIMGILNFTPDSFSDGGNYFDINTAIKQVEKMISEGADIIDIGAESTRPGATVVSSEEERRRLELVLPKLLEKFPDVCFSVDTYKSEIADFVLTLGDDVINDVYGAKDNDMATVVAKYDREIIVMHNGDVESGREIEQVTAELAESINICLEAGISKDNIIVDPGMGFGKDAKKNIEITKNLQLLQSLGCEILYAVSRKRTTDYLLGGETKPTDRDIVSATLSLEAIRRGARIVRVHNVKVMKEMLVAYESINN